MNLSYGSGDGVVRVMSGPSPTSDDSNTSLRKHCGMGMLLNKRTILTCAHVLKAAWQETHRDEDDSGDDHIPPVWARDPVAIKFPLGRSTATIMAKVVPRSLKVAKFNEGDHCLLKLEEDAPDDVGFAVLADIKSMPASDNELRVFGIRGNELVGGHFEGRFNGRVGGGWTQIVGNSDSEVFAAGGFSGAAVWDINLKAVVGMMVATKPVAALRDRISYCIPTSSLKRDLGDMIEVEIRRTTPNRHRALRMSSFLLFTVTLLHFLAMRNPDWNIPMPWVENDSAIAALFGATMFGLIAPTVYIFFFLHFKSFSGRRWCQRIPPAFDRLPEAGLNNTRLGAGFAVLMLLVLPVIGQAHFIEYAFYRKAKLGVYPNDVKISATKNDINGECVRDPSGKSISNDYCHFPETDLIFKPIPRGAQMEFPYDNFRYVHGHNGVSYFPYIQPFLIFSSIILGLCVLTALLIPSIIKKISKKRPLLKYLSPIMLLLKKR